MLHLNPEAKEEIATKVIETFKEMDRIWVTVFYISVSLNHNSLGPFSKKEIKLNWRFFSSDRDPGGKLDNLYKLTF